MRPLEILFAGLTVVAALLLRQGRRYPGAFLAAAAFLAALAHVLLEGAHWQMIPAYAALGVLALVCAFPAARRGKLSWLAAIATVFLAGASVVCSVLVPMFRLPMPTGPYPIGTAILDCKDGARIEDAVAGGLPRELVVQLWYPAQSSSKPFARYRRPRETRRMSSYQAEIVTHSRLDAPVADRGAPFPVILLNHGWGSRRTNDTFLAEELASRGYIVASIDHTYNAGQVEFADGRVVYRNVPYDVDLPDASTAERVQEIWNKELRKQAADERFVLDFLEGMNRSAGTPWLHRIDTANAGAIGHSFGGSASTEICAIDPRVHASVNMDGWFFDAIRARGANQPLLYVISGSEGGNTASRTPAGVEAKLDMADMGEAEVSLQRFGGYLLRVAGAQHDDFTDEPLVSPLPALSHRGTVPAAELQRILRSYVVAFFDKTLRHQDSPLLKSQTGPFPEASLEVWPPGNASNAASNRDTTR